MLQQDGYVMSDRKRLEKVNPLRRGQRADLRRMSSASQHTGPTDKNSRLAHTVSPPRKDRQQKVLHLVKRAETGGCTIERKNIHKQGHGASEQRHEKKEETQFRRLAHSSLQVSSHSFSSGIRMRQAIKSQAITLCGTPVCAAARRVHFSVGRRNRARHPTALIPTEASLFASRHTEQQRHAWRLSPENGLCHASNPLSSNHSSRKYKHLCRELLALEPYMALPARELTADLTADRCELPAAGLGSRSEPFSRGMSFCLYASRSGANKKSPVSVDWHYMTLRNHCQKAS
ncbi:hypothetical protein EYF80_002287 [Liparis tanakae]|uniref:Uncharacterized protein n=1 Tax=Liparis tanakae TaxID=230148 RepID=A0A4Z2JBQ3_9TELE|nr:hypothetical protein EYF80_002287 [Liparis tanakae]